VNRTLMTLVALLAGLAFAPLASAAESPEAVVARMDVEYQAAVERNDWQAMDRILHPDFVLVVGDGTVYTRAQLIDSARNANIVYEQQREVPGSQVVRMYGKDTATVTALLILKGKRAKDQSPVDFRVWFTDTYVRTDKGWRYALGQAGARLPAAP
jgi:ketosteroid isomerase-like protein